MKIICIAGSPRTGSQSLKVARWLCGEVERLGAEITLVDLHQEALSIDYDEVTQETGSDYERWRKISAQLEEADGYLVVTPEWNGMPTGALMAFFAYVKKEMSYKPVYVCSVTSGVRGGSNPIGFLKGAMNKNSYHIVLPEYLIVRDVEHAMNSQEPENDNDSYTRERAQYGLEALLKSAELLQPLREWAKTKIDIYSSGM